MLDIAGAIAARSEGAEKGRVCACLGMHRGCILADLWPNGRGFETRGWQVSFFGLFVLMLASVLGETWNGESETFKATKPPATVVMSFLIAPT